ncbi:MmgE/PrpD family protein [Microaerobacter geothermalis]|uniref:MmgE/PrpD family protein n=1 Tax=Microaerobacter geothermalis TaxID=674972 RepID=UPI001F42A709|nr:MmgE/PrpD family protein [Microaerobacter geothermalis]MCF6094023.1 MmgE/PrpD family protein [Microaerobacter geothermalis]
MTYSRKFAEYVVNHRFDGMTEEAVQFTKRSILDWVGSAIAGGKEKPALILNQTLKQFGGNPQATNFVSFEKTSAHYAALVNGGSSHILELDDVHKASILHAGASIIPAAFAAAEWKNVTGKELVEAVALGFEVGIRIGEAVTPSHYDIFHTTGTVGTFGAAAAVGKILQLSVEEMIHAFGSAGTQAAGLWEFIEDGAMSKQLHPAKAAANGLLSAALAKERFTGATRILEGRRGFFAGLVKEVNTYLLFQGLGESYKIVENTFKIHSCCRHIHPTLDLLQEMVQEHDDLWNRIDQVLIEVYQVALNITEKYDPKSVYEAKFSLPYASALMLKKGKAGLDEFTEENLDDPEIRNMMERITLRVNEEYNQRYPKVWPARVSIRLKDGTILQKETFYPKGDPENPATEKELIDKFSQLASKGLTSNKVNQLAEMLMNLEEVKDVSRLV